ncbi:MAG: diacylglycerol kinase family protein [Bacillota bacterium]
MVHVLCNVLSGGGRASRILGTVVESLKERGLSPRVRVAVTMAGCREEAQAVRDENPATVVVVGGDGTLREVGRVFAGTGIPLLIVPAGTGNGLAYSLRLPLSPERCLDLLDTGQVRNMDVAQTGAGLFLNVAGVGLDAEVAGRAKRLQYVKGLPAYVVTVLEKLHDFSPFKYRIRTDEDCVMQGKAILVAVGNGSCYGKNIGIVPGAEAFDGWLDLCVVEQLKPLELSTVIGMLMAGRLHHHPRVRRRRVRKAEIATDPPHLVHLDGDVMASTPVTVEVLPGALSVFV